MRNTNDQATMKQTVREQLLKQFQNSGLLEYSCNCRRFQSQIFSTWQINATCNRCGQKFTATAV